MKSTKRSWTSEQSQSVTAPITLRTTSQSAAEIAEKVASLATRCEEIHTKDCFNLNPATNVMNPIGEALLASGIGTRPSLGHPGEKYETGLEATEEIEVITATLCQEIFDAKYAEIRVPSGAIANMMAFMATCRPGDTIIAPPASIAGHVTHHSDGCAGLYGLNIVEAPIDNGQYTIDIDALRTLAKQCKPSLITVGSSLNLFEHPVRQVREIADEVGAKVMFDAAHQCGIIAGRQWSNPLTEGAHLMTMSTYKSLGGPPGGLIVSNESDLMQRIDAIAYPGLTANFDAAKSAALAICMLDWREHGVQYAEKMISVAGALAQSLAERGVPVYAEESGYTRSHQFAVKAAKYGGGQTASQKLRQGGFLTCGIGLPLPEVAGDLNGLRIGTPEIVRFGVKEAHTSELAELITRVLDSDSPVEIAAETKALRSQFQTRHYLYAG